MLGHNLLALSAREVCFCNDGDCHMWKIRFICMKLDIMAKEILCVVD